MYVCLLRPCGHLLALVCNVYRNVVTFLLVSSQVWCLIVSIPDLCPFSYFGTNGTKGHREWSVSKTSRVFSFSSDIWLSDQTVFKLNKTSLFRPQLLKYTDVITSELKP